MSKRIVIVGNGVAGTTAAIRLQQLDARHDVTIISEETPYFFSRPALMYVFMGHMKFEHTQPYENHFWAQQQLKLIHDRVTEVNFKLKTLSMARAATISYDVLIFATGSVSNKFGWPGQELEGVTGFYHKQDLERLQSWANNAKAVAVVGGGLIGIEMAEMLNRAHKKVYFLVRDRYFWSSVLDSRESGILEKHIRASGIELILGDELKEIKGEGKVSGILTKNGKELDCQIVGLAVGVSPQIDLVKGSLVDTNKGILVDEYLETSIKDVYALGDCAELKKTDLYRKPIEAVWYTARKMGETVAQTISGIPTRYDQGVWYNSAKFIEIEYQTYGYIPARLEERQGEYFWEKGEKAIRLVYDKTSQLFEGINTFGIRMRQAYFENAINNKRSIQWVIAHLDEANFDPEFFERINLSETFSA